MPNLKMSSACLSLSRTTFVALIAFGAIVRVFAFQSPGMSDLTDFGIWMYNGVIRGPTQLYGVGGRPPESRVLTYDGENSIADYPPVALYELTAAGHVYRVAGGRFPDLKALVLPIKLLGTSAVAGLALLIWSTARHRSGAGPARFAAAAYWLNPTVILHSALLGYIGSLAALPAIGALIAADASWALTSGALLAIAVWTKPQGVLVAPAIALALARTKRDTAPLVKSALAGAVTATAIIILPFVRAGALTNVLYAFGGLLSDGTLSAQAANVWWLVGYATDVVRSFGQLGPAVFLVENRIFTLGEVLDLHGSAFGTPLGAWAIAAAAWTTVGLAVSWAAWRARARNDFTTTIGLAAFTVHAYFILAVQVHENHMVLTLPLLALIASEHQPYRRLLVALSAIIVLNLYLFYGFGEGVEFAVPRSATMIDATVLLAVANVGAFVWHARVFARSVGSCRRTSRTLSREWLHLVKR